MQPPPPDAAAAPDTRQRLLQAGLRLFAQQGFAKTSTRELAETAAVNIAAISYHFGDKAGLYRAVFFEPMGDVAQDLARFADPATSLGDALRGFYAAFVQPLRDGDVARLCMKLRCREMLEPTGLWEEEILRGILPLHQALVALLCREFGAAAPDDEIQRLAVCLAGLGVNLHLARDVTDALAPGLYSQPHAIDHWADSLARFALAMVASEGERRLAAAARGTA